MAFAIKSNGQCGKNKGEVYVHIKTMSYANEIYWRILDSNSNAVDSVLSGVYTNNNSSYIDTVCLDLNARYTFEAWDKWGDGWDGGTYSLQFGNKTIINNGGNSPDNGNNANGNDERESSENFSISVDTLPDLALLEILSPRVNTCKNTQFNISAKVQVKDSNTVDTILFQYKIDNGSWSSQQFVFNPALQIDSIVTLTFSSSPSSSAIGNHRIHVKAKASRDDNQSNDTLSAVFTNDSAKTTFPISLDFDGATSCGNSSSTCIANGSCNLGTIWMNMPGDDLDWSLGSGTTNSLGTGPENDHTKGNSSGKYLFLESSGCQGSEAYLQLNCAELNQMSNPYLEFWYHMYGDKMGKLYVEINTNGTWNVIDSLIGEQQDSSAASWSLKRVNLANYKTTANLRIRGVVGTGFTSDMAIDDITVRDIPQNYVVTQELIMPADSSCGDSNTIISVVVSNEGIQPATGFYVLLYNSPHTIVYWNQLYKDTLQFGETDTIHYTGINTYAGLNTWFLSRVYYTPGKYVDYYSFKNYFKYPTAQNIADTGRCGAGSLEVYANAANGDEVRWYSDRNGNNLISTGDTLQTGNLTQNTYFYHKTASINGGCATEMDSVEVIINSGISTQLQANNPSGYRMGNNAWNAPDSFEQGDTFIHQIAVPTGYQQSQYGSRWNVAVSSQTARATANSAQSFSASSTQRPTLIFWGNAANADSTYAITYTVTDQQTGCDTQFTKYVYIIPKPEANFSATTVCAGNSTSFYDSSHVISGSLQYNWNFGDGNSSTNANPTHIFASAGTYLVTLITNTNLNVLDSITKTVSVNAIPSADFTANGVCAYDSASLLNRSAVATGNLTYNWNLGNGQTATTSDVRHFYGSVGQYTVQLIASSGAGCNDTATKTLSVFPIPTAGFSVANVCLDDTARFIDTSSLATSYSWNLGGGNSSSDASPVLNYNTSGTYSITQIVNSANGCVDTATAQLQVYAMPSLQLSTSNQCLYDSVVVNDNSSNASTYQWIWGDNDTSTQVRGAHKYTASGNYSIIVNVASANNCLASDTLSATLYSVPTANFSASTACETDTTIFSNQSSITTGFISSKWFFGTGDSSQQISPKYLYDSADVYRVQLLTRSLNGCVDTATKMVTVNQNPSLDFSISGSCTDDTTFITNSSQGSSSQVWTFAGTDSTVAFQTKRVFNNAGTYSIWLYAQTNKGCKDSLSKTWQVYQAPNAIFTTSNVCHGDSVELQNFSSNAQNITWAFGDGDSSTVLAPKKLYSQSGQYSIQLTVANANCVDSSSKTIRVYNAPTSDFSALNVCLGDTTHFYDSSLKASSQTWLFGNGLNSTAQSPSLVYTAAGNYNVQLITSTPNNCVDTVTKTVSVYNLPVANFSSVSTICATDSFSLTNSSTGATAYQWTMGNGDTLSAQNIDYAYSANGTYTIALLSTNTNGCTDQDSAVIDVFAMPQAAFTATNVCKGLQSSFSNQTSIATGTVSSAWNFGDGVGTSINKNPAYTYSSDGVYNVKLIATSNKGCQDSVMLNDTVYALPQPSFSAAAVCQNDSTAFANNSSNAVSHTWNFGDGSSSTQSAPKHLYAAAGNYTVKLISTSSNGCVDSISKNITVYSVPVAGISVNNNCLNDSTRLSSISSNATAFAWNLGDASTSNLANPVHLYSSIGVKNLELIATSSNGCKDTATSSVEIYSLPVAAFSANDTCFGDTTYFSNQSTGGVSYSWDFGNSSASSAVNPKLRYANQQNYTVSLIATTNKGCKDTVIKTVKVHAIPAVSFSQVGSICQNDSFQITNSTTGAISYSWAFGNSGVSTVPAPKYAYTTHGAFIISQRAENSFGCFVIDSTSILVNPEPQVSFSTSNVCDNQTSRFTNKSAIASGSMTYAWDFGDASGSSALANPTYTYAKEGVYNVKLIATSNKGCQDSAMLNETVYALPQPRFSAAAVCQNDSTAFVNNSSNAVSHTWTFGDGSSSTQSAPKHLYAAAGTYTVKLISTSSNGCVDSTSKNITVYSLPLAGISVNNNCLNDSTHLSSTSSNATAFAWNLGDASTSNLANPVHLYSSTGVKNLELIATSSNGCKDTATSSVEIYSLPVAAFSANDTCFGDTTYFSNQSTGGVSYSWDFGNSSASSAVNPKLRYANQQNYTVSLIATTNKGCKDTVTKTVKVHAIPAVSFNQVSSICQNDSFQITNSTTGAISYSWAFGNSGVSTVTAPKYAYTTHGTFIISQRAENGFGCFVIDSASILVNPEPQVSFSTSNVCDNQISRFTNKSNIATGSMTYAWDFGDASGSSALINPSYTYSTDGVYNVKLIATSNKGCQDSAMLNDTVYALPQPSFSAAAVCQNDSTAFVYNSSNAVSHTWDFGDGSSSTQSAPKHLYAAAGTYSVKLISTSINGCVDSISKNITVYSLPIAGISVNNNCLNDSTRLSSISSNATAFAWNLGDASTSNLANPVHLYSGTGVKNLELIATSSNGCKDTATSSVEIYSLPVAAFSANDTCFGDTTYFSNQSTGGISYSWDFGNSSASSAVNPKLRYANQQNYTVSLIATTNKGCKDTLTKTVKVHAIPAVSFSQVGSICQNDSFQITNNTTGATSYSWTFGNSSVSTIASPKYAYTNPGNFNIQQRAENSFGCFVIGSANILVNPEPQVSFSTNNVCDNETSRFTNKSAIASGSMTYAWDFGDASGSSALTNPSYTYSTDGVYSVKLIATSNKGCQDSVMLNDTVYALPQPNFSAAAVCQNDSTAFVNNSSNAVSHTWDFGDGSSSTQSAPKHLYAAAGSYTVKLISTSANGCVDSISKTITVYSLPVAGISVNNNCLNDSTRLSSTSSNATAYAWNLGDASTSNLANPVHLYSSTGVKNLELIATSSNGCKDTASSSVEIYSLPVAAFSANDTCFGDTTYFSNQSTGGVSYSWDFGNSSASSAVNPKLRYANQQNYIVSLIATTNKGCKDTVIKAVKVHAIPAVSFSQVGSICQNDSFQITNNTTEATSYSWTFGNSVVSTVPAPKYAYTTHGTFTISQRAENGFGCFVIDSASILVNPEPQVSFSTSNVCDNQTSRFTNKSAIASGSMTYAWDFGDASGSSALTNPSYTYSTDGVYNVKLIATSNKGCQDSAMLNDTVYALPQPSFSATAVCQNDSTSFVNNSSNAISHTWGFGDGSSSTQSAPKHLYAAAGTYTVKLISTSSNGCVDSISKNITVYSLPLAGISVNNNCLNDSTRLSSTTSNATSFTWNLGDATTSNLANPVHLYSSTGVKNLELIATSSNGCKDTATSSVEIYSLPVAAFSANDTCFGDTTYFSNQSTGGVSYSWDFGNGVKDTFANKAILYSNSGSYLVSLRTTTNNGCLDSITKQIQVHKLPKSGYSVNDVCLGDTTHFVSSSTGAFSYQWVNGNAKNLTSGQLKHVYVNAGNYPVWLIATSSQGCRDSTLDTARVFVDPKANFTVSDVCLKDTAFFSNTSKDAQTVNWRFGDGGASSAINPSHYFKKAGNYDVQLVASTSNGCVDTIKKVLTIKAIPTVSFNVDRVICQYDSLSVVNNSTGASQFTWSFGNQASSADSIPKVQLNAFGNIMVKLVATSSANCRIADSIAVRINPSPVAQFSVGNVCKGDTTIFVNSSTIGQGNMTYWWDLGDNLGYSAKRSPKYIRQKDGVFTTKLVVRTAAACADSIEMTDTVHALPQMAFKSDSVCHQDSTSFTNQSSGAMSYNWTIDGATYQQLNPKYRFPNAGNQLVKLIGESSKGCLDSISKNVVVRARPIANFQANPVCLGDSTLFINQSISSVQTEWDFGTTNSTLSTPNHLFANAGNFNVQLKVTALNQCQDSIVKSVRVNALPVASFISNDTCHGDTTYFVNSSSSNTKAEWTFGDGNLSQLSQPKHVYKQAGNYNVQLVVTNLAKCTDTASSTVSVYQNPKAAFGVVNVCLYDSAEFNNQSVGGIKHIWSLNLVDADTNRNVTYKYNAAGKYTIKLIEESSFGCLDSASTILEVYQPPVASFTVSDVCFGDSTQIVQSSQNALYYDWNFGNGARSNQQTPELLYGKAGSYAIQLAVEDGKGCKDTAVRTANAWANPVSKFAVTANCIGDTSMFNNQTVGATKYTWHMGNNVTLTDANPKYVYANADTFSVWLFTENDKGCKDSVMKTHEVGNVPKADFDTTLGCEFKGIFFANRTNTYSEPVSYFWDFDYNDVTSTKTNPVQAFNHSGSYMVSLIAKNHLGCVDTVVKQVDVRPAPQAQFELNQLVCVDQAVKLKATTFSFTDHLWVIGQDSIKGDSIFYTFSSAGKQKVVLHAGAENGCQTQASKTIEIGQLPIARFVANLENCEGEVIDFLDLSTIQGRENLRYNWSFGDSEQSYSQDPTHTYRQAGQYAVKQMVSTQQGCTDTFERSLVIHPSPKLKLGVDIVGAYVYFTPGDTSLASYYWDFGNNQTSRFAKPRNWYDENGKYFINLRGETKNGCAAEVDTIITVLTTDVDLAGNGIEFSAYPNPFKNSFQLEIEAAKADQVQVQLLDQNGALVQNQEQQLLQGSNTFQVNTNQLAAGVYQLRLIASNGIKVERLVKAK